MLIDALERPDARTTDAIPRSRDVNPMKLVLGRRAIPSDEESQAGTSERPFVSVDGIRLAAVLRKSLVFIPPLECCSRFAALNEGDLDSNGLHHPRKN